MNPAEQQQLFADFFEIQNQFGYSEITRDQLEIKVKALLDRYKPDDATFERLVDEECGIAEIDRLLRDLR